VVIVVVMVVRVSHEDGVSKIDTIL
jgi:hypothetical protein